MKKTILCISLLAASSVGFAADLTAGGKTALTPTECAMIATGQTANIQLSADVTGSYDCSSSNAGVGTAHPKGKGKSYMASSNGGKIAETSASADFASVAAAQAAAGARATEGKNAS
jgi:hypothetical protein